MESMYALDSAKEMEDTTMAENEHCNTIKSRPSKKILSKKDKRKDDQRRNEKKRQKRMIEACEEQEFNHTGVKFDKPENYSGTNGKKDRSRFYISNGYGTSVYLMNKNEVSDRMIEILHECGKSNDGIPFYVLKTRYLKTAVNMINDIIDLVYYSQDINKFNTNPEVVNITVDFSLTRNHILKFIAQEKYEHRAFRIVSNIVNKTNADKLENVDGKETYHALTPEGDVIMWSPETFHNNRYIANSEYVIVEKEVFNIFFEWLEGYITDMPYPPTAHQWASIKYLKLVYDQKVLPTR